MANSIDAMIGYHREWLDKNGARILAREEKYLLEDIEDGSPQAFQNIPDSLDGLGTYFGILGTVELLDGNENGWNHIATSIDYRGWGLKLRAESFFRDLGVRAVNLTNYVSRAACLVCVSEKWGQQAERILRRVSENHDSVDQGYWNSRRFEPFVLRCCAIRDGEEADSSGLEKPYADIIENWNNEDGLANGLESVCEYHCANMDDVGGDWDPEFKHSPFDLMPCEFILVKRIRDTLGLATPSISHRLLSVIGTKLPSVESENEMLLKLSGAFDRCYA